MENFDLSQIVGTFKYGEYTEESPKKLIISYSILIAVFVLAIIGVIVGLSINQVENPEPIIKFIFLLIGMVLAFAILPTTFSILLAITLKARKEILLWLEDSVEVYAHSKRVGTQDHGDVILDLISGPSSAKIQVTFTIGKKHYTRISGKKGRLGISDNGFQRIWLDYSDRAIRILYSPKYDQVIVLKDKEEN